MSFLIRGCSCYCSHFGPQIQHCSHTSVFCPDWSGTGSIRYRDVLPLKLPQGCPLGLHTKLKIYILTMLMHDGCQCCCKNSICSRQSSWWCREGKIMRARERQQRQEMLMLPLALLGVASTNSTGRLPQKRLWMMNRGVQIIFHQSLLNRNVTATTANLLSWSWNKAIFVSFHFTGNGQNKLKWDPIGESWW